MLIQALGREDDGFLTRSRFTTSTSACGACFAIFGGFPDLPLRASVHGASRTTTGLSSLGEPTSSPLTVRSSLLASSQPRLSGRGVPRVARLHRHQDFIFAQSAQPCALRRLIRAGLARRYEDLRQRIQSAPSVARAWRSRDKPQADSERDALVSPGSTSHRARRRLG